MFFHFAPVWLATHPVDKSFETNDAVIAEFKKFLTDQGVDFSDADIAAAGDWLKIHIKQQIVTVQFGTVQGMHMAADWDPMIQKAITYLPEAQALENTAQKVLTEKADARSAGAASASQRQ